MKLVLNTFAALALTATTAFAASAAGPAMDRELASVSGTSGQEVMIKASGFSSKRSGDESVNGKITVTRFEGASEIDTTPGGAHFR